MGQDEDRGGIFADSWQRLASARTAGGDELVLRRRGDDYEIRCNGAELMANRAHHSEETLARLACAPLAAVPVPVVLIGGLGMGYTVRAALEALPAAARVVVAEALPEVVAWNRGPLAPLAGRPLDDHRVEVAVDDVAALLRRTRRGFDAVVLDVDNGPDALSLVANAGLYTAEGLGWIAAALRADGVLAVWAADRSPAFEARLDAAGYAGRLVAVPAREGCGDPCHSLYLARLRP